MTAAIGPAAEAALARLRAIDLAKPRHDRAAVERAISAHLEALGLPARPFVWAPDAATSYKLVTERVGARDVAWDAARNAAWNAAWDAATAVAQLGGLTAFDHPTTAKLAGIWSPMIDAYEAGLLLYWVTPRDVICVEAPSLSLRDGRLHNEDGPAVEWPSGERYYFWRGLQVPAELITERDKITVASIRGEANLELRRVRVELYGRERFLRDSGAVLKHEDRFGRLWRADAGQDAEPWTVVEVENATIEHGERRKFFLRVPPDMRTAHEAVAWTFYRTPETYRPEVQT